MLPKSAHMQYYLTTIFLLFTNTVLLMTYTPYANTYANWMICPESSDTGYKKNLIMLSTILTGIHAFL
jgi:hypothetical protein